ncbi:unnamed protein product [Ambrosiozyma monospora]|uniref:amidase n=1 Tax=Ambrosiozyma monospora TaxID=43982 RepID=A0A9W7DK59_AMBMO|nr:unnamed protein product [Ambrosiozyma monospora]
MTITELEISAPTQETLEPLYKVKDDMSNPTKFKQWEPKIKAYQDELARNTPPEYKVPETEIPGTLDTVPFNSIKFISETKHLSLEERTITNLTATELASAIASKKYTSVAVLKAFAHRCVIAHQFTNLAVQFFINEGIKRAQELDDHLANTGKTVGPLHGVPISLKEHMGYAGKVTHGGWVSYLDNIPKESDVTIDILYKLGCVFYVRTNEPQGLMMLDTDNNITGRTRNTHNSLLTSGGSSGGEGVCVSARGSPWGVGTDIGGSIRSPAAFSGVYGLKPTSKRVSLAGTGVSPGKGQESVYACAGPLTNSIDDIELFMDAYVNMGKPWNLDQNSLPMPWRHEVATTYKKPSDITVAIMWDDGLVRPQPPITRGLKYLQDKLSQAGVKVIKFDPIETQLAYDVVNDLYSCDGNFKAIP